MNKTSNVINCGPLRDNRLLCGTINSNGDLTNMIDRPLKIHEVNNNGKNYLFERYNIPCFLLEYIGTYETGDTKSYSPPLIVTYSQNLKTQKYPHIPMFKKGYCSIGKQVYLQYEDKVVGYTFLYGGHTFQDEYMITHILRINNKTNKLDILYTNNTHGEDIRQFPSLLEDLNQVFVSSND